jgi:protoheme IX farnesyltransferase
VTQLADRVVPERASQAIAPVSPAALARAQQAATRDVRAVVRAYVSLTKPRIVELLLVTTVPAMLLAAHGIPALWLVAVVLVGGSLAAGAANALNCYLDRDIDQVMKRTSRRPLPAHTVSPRAALVFGLTLAVLSTILMAAFTNPLATALTAGAIAYYDLVYTKWLKRTTPANTVWGGACGAAPVLIGWAAVTGGLSWPAWVLFASCSSGSRRTSTPSPSSSRTTTRRPASRCCRSWRARAGSARDRRLQLADSARVARAVAARHDPALRRGAVVVGALLLLEAHRLDGRIRRGEPVEADAPVPLVDDLPDAAVPRRRGRRLDSVTPMQ